MAATKSMGYIKAMGKDMNILPGEGEDRNHYKERVILSAGASWMLVALHTNPERISIEAVKRTVAEKLRDYFHIADCQPMPEVQIVTDYLYDILLANGMFYHEQYYVRPVRNRLIGIGNVSFVRGMLPEENVSFSGMAPYVLGGGNDVLEDEFSLWNRNGDETIRSAWTHSSPQERTIRIGEYLRIDRTEGQTYFDPRRYDNAEITLGRTRNSDNSSFSYYLIRNNEIRRLSDDYVNASVQDYIRLAIVNSHSRQGVLAKVSGNLVEIEIGYLLPRSDRRFLRFISWPDSLASLDNWYYRVSLHPKIWPVVKNRLSFLGYAVEEQHE